MPSRVKFYLLDLPDDPGPGKDRVNEWLQTTAFAAQGGPFQIESRERGSLPGYWLVTLAGTVPQGAQAGIKTALEASPLVLGTVTWDEV